MASGAERELEKLKQWRSLYPADYIRRHFVIWNHDGEAEAVLDALAKLKEATTDIRQAQIKAAEQAIDAVQDRLNELRVEIDNAKYDDNELPKAAFLAGQAAAPTSLSTGRLEVAWLIERGGLCLGFCEYHFTWVTFTNENALRFSRQRDAYSFKEAMKWEPKHKQLFDAIVTEHSWEPATAEQPAPAKEKQS